LVAGPTPATCQPSLTLGPLACGEYPLTARLGRGPTPATSQPSLTLGPVACNNFPLFLSDSVVDASRFRIASGRYFQKTLAT